MSDLRTIDCERVLRLLFLYLDGELEVDERHDVEHHLEHCRSCFSRAEFERRLRSHLAELGRSPVAADFEGRIRSLIRHFTHP